MWFLFRHYRAFGQFLCDLDVYKNAYLNRKHYDLLSNVPRLLPPPNALVIVFQRRWGDYKDHFDKEMSWHRPIKYIKKILNDRESVFYGLENYKIYLVSEVHKTRENVEIGSTADFKEIMHAFPSSKIELRVNHSQHLEDLDLVSIADVFVFDTHSSFTMFLANYIIPSRCVLIDLTKQDRQLLLNSRRQRAFRSTNFTNGMNAFNRALCPFYRSDHIQEKCKQLNFIW